MLLVVSSLKLIAEIALLAMAGQWVLGLLAGPRRDGNAVYRLLQVMTEPFVRLARAVTPRRLDRRVPLVAALLLATLWLAATAAKIGLCLQAGIETCR